MSTINIKQPKLQNIVVLRSFAIIAVVLYHCYCPWLKAWDWYECEYRALYSYIFETILVGRMPLFVCVSGYLFSHLYIDRGKYHEFGAFIKNKVKRLLVPCFLFTGLMCLILRLNYFENVIGYGFHLWFLKMLFFCFLTTWICVKYIHSVKSDICVGIITVIMMFIPAPEFLGIGQYFKYYFFFYGGYLMYKYRDPLKFIYNEKVAIIIVGLYITICVICAYRYILNPMLANGDIIHLDKVVVLCRIMLRPLMIIMAFIIVDLYIKRRGEVAQIFDRINKLSYGIYLFHMLFLQMIHTYYFNYSKQLFGTHDIIAPIFMFNIVFSLSILFTILLRKSKWGVYLIG